MNLRLLLLVFVLSVLNFSCSISDETSEDGKLLVKGKIVELKILYSQLYENHIEMFESDTEDVYVIDEINYNIEELKEYLANLNEDDYKYGILI